VNASRRLQFFHVEPPIQRFGLWWQFRILRRIELGKVMLACIPEQMTQGVYFLSDGPHCGAFGETLRDVLLNP
jgi:hypothetical protein